MGELMEGAVQQAPQLRDLFRSDDATAGDAADAAEDEGEADGGGGGAGSVHGKEGKVVDPDSVAQYDRSEYQII